MNALYKMLSALVTAAFVSCSDSTPTRTEYISQPTQELPALKKDDCEVGKLHEALYETIGNYNGFAGLNVISSMTIETRVWGNKRVPGQGYIGHDRINGMYVRGLGGETTPFYFSEGYVPLGDEMACDLAEKLLRVAELAKVKVQ